MIRTHIEEEEQQQIEMVLNSAFDPARAQTAPARDEGDSEGMHATARG